MRLRSGHERFVRPDRVAQVEPVAGERAATRLDVGQPGCRSTSSTSGRSPPSRPVAPGEHRLLATFHVDLHDVDRVGPVLGEQAVECQGAGP